MIPLPIMAATGAVTRYVDIEAIRVASRRNCSGTPPETLPHHRDLEQFLKGEEKEPSIAVDHAGKDDQATAEETGRHKLRGYATQLTRDEDVSEDLVQDSCELAMRYQEQKKAGASMRGIVTPAVVATTRGCDSFCGEPGVIISALSRLRPPRRSGYRQLENRFGSGARNVPVRARFTRWACCRWERAYTSQQEPTTRHPLVGVAWLHKGVDEECHENTEPSATSLDSEHVTEWI